MKIEWISSQSDSEKGIRQEEIIIYLASTDISFFFNRSLLNWGKLIIFASHINTHTHTTCAPTETKDRTQTHCSL